LLENKVEMATEDSFKPNSQRTSTPTLSLTPKY